MATTLPRLDAPLATVTAVTALTAAFSPAKLPSLPSPSLGATLPASLPSAALPTLPSPSVQKLATLPLPPIGGSVEEEEDDDDEASSPVEPASTALVPVGTTMVTTGAPTDMSFESMMQTRATPMYEHPALHVVAMVNFFDGYTVRQLFEFYKQGLTCAPMFFTSGPNRGINIIRGNSGQHGPTMIVNTRIRGDDLVEYSVDTERWNWKEKRCHVINVNLGDFHAQIKSVAKKESIRMFQYAEYPDYVFLQFYGGNKNSEGWVHVKTERFEDVKYNIEDGVDGTDASTRPQPNVRVPLPMFCAACANIVKAKYHFAVLNVYPKGAHLLGGSDIGSSSRNAHWGDCSGLDPAAGKRRLVIAGKTATPVRYTTRIPSTVVKALNKTANFNTAGIVKMYGRGDCLTRLEIPVGTYADTTIHLIEPSMT